MQAWVWRICLNAEVSGNVGAIKVECQFTPPDGGGKRERQIGVVKIHGEYKHFRHQHKGIKNKAVITAPYRMNN